MSLNHCRDMGIYGDIGPRSRRDEEGYTFARATCLAARRPEKTQSAKESPLT